MLCLIQTNLSAFENDKEQEEYAAAMAKLNEKKKLPTHAYAD